jgi:hypothetical protein
MMPRNWLVSWNAPCCAPVAASPELRERIGEIGAGEPEDGHECWRQRAAVVEEGVERIGDVTLVDVQAGGAKRAGEVQDCISRRVAQRSGEASGEIARGQRVERGAAEPARGREDRIADRPSSLRRPQREQYAKRQRGTGY